MSTSILVPSATLDTNLDLNMTEIAYAEGRLDEIAIVNTHKAPELMSCFIKGYTWCKEHITNLTAELVKAETAANFRKAEIILEEVPRILTEKGITGKSNADYRDAVIAMDKKHIELMERANHIGMYVEMFKGKLESLDRAYMAVRKILGTGMDFRNPNLGSNHSLNSFEVGLYSPPPVHVIYPVAVQPLPTTGTPPPNTTITTARAGFGKARE